MEEIEHIIRQPTTRTHKTPLLLQHGAWHGAWCWEYWLDYFPSLGYEVHAISLPGHGQSSHTKKHINFYTFSDYVNILASEVNKISPVPVVVGHSLGGAVVQKYLETAKLPGAVLLATLPASGMAGMVWRWMGRHPVAMLKGLLTLNSHHWVGTPQLAQELFLGTEPSFDVNKFCKQLVQESAAVGLQVMLPFAKVNRTKTPILVLAGEQDMVFTVAEEKATADRYKAECVVVKGQAHNLMMEPAWQRVANIVDEWITNTVSLP